MKKMRVFFMATILFLSTIVVIAGRKAYFITGDLYILQPTGYYRLNSSFVLTSNVTTVGIGSPCTITGSAGIPYGLYINTGTGGFKPLYSVAW